MFRGKLCVNLFIGFVSWSLTLSCNYFFGGRRGGCAESSTFCRSNQFEMLVCWINARISWRSYLIHAPSDENEVVHAQGTRGTTEQNVWDSQRSQWCAWCSGFRDAENLHDVTCEYSVSHFIWSFKIKCHLRMNWTQ